MFWVIIMFVVGFSLLCGLLGAVAGVPEVLPAGCESILGVVAAISLLAGIVAGLSDSDSVYGLAAVALPIVFLGGCCGAADGNWNFNASHGGTAPILTCAGGVWSYGVPDLSHGALVSSAMMLSSVCLAVGLAIGRGFSAARGSS